MQSFTFTSFKVRVRVESNEPELLDEARSVAYASLLGKIKMLRSKKADVVFRLHRRGPRSYDMILNDEPVSTGRSRFKFLKFFDAMIRATVGEYAPEDVFIHAGAVGWKGKAIILPADSFKGKSTITAELVRLGAAYYSDDFAIFDRQGMLRPFPRNISMRDEYYRPYDIELDALGAARDEPPIPVGLVLFTEYKKGARWRPQITSAGHGALELIQYALSFRRAPELCLSVLNLVARNAIIASSPRGTAEVFAPLILDLVDKRVN